MPGAPPGVAPPWPGFSVHKPGVLPLRPLGLGDIYDAAFKTIRRNPRAMVGLAALVMAACAALPAALSVALAFAGQLRLAPSGLNGLGSTQAMAGVAEVYGATTLARLLSVLGQIVLTGMIARVVFGAVVGRATSISEAWRPVRGRFWRLVGLALLGAIVAVAPFMLAIVAAVAVGFAVDSAGVGVAIGLLGGAGGFVWLVFAEVRLVSLSTAALVIEQLGVLAAMRRTWVLTRRQFWRVLGIWLLTGILVAVAGEILSIPFGVAGGVLTAFGASSSWGGLGVVASNLLSSIVVGAVITPFTAGVMALLYVDQRIRKEGYDVELIAAAQPTAMPPAASMPPAPAAG
jgi:hypothetical protein